MAIGFLALLKGDSLSKEITITGTLERDGTIGQVTQVAEKTTAAAAEDIVSYWSREANFMPLESIELRSVLNPRYWSEK